MEFLMKANSNENCLDRMEDEEEREKYEEWLEKFKNSVQCDKWGQVVEAVEAYQALDRTLTHLLETTSILDTAALPRKQRENLAKTTLLMKLRIATIEDPGFEGPSFDEMDMVEDRFVAISSGHITFPLPVEEYEFGTNIDHIAHFESMTPLRGEIEIRHDSDASSLDKSGDVDVLGEEKSERAKNANTSPKGYERSMDTVEVMSPKSSANATGLTRYAESQLELEERAALGLYSIAANAIYEGGALKPPKDPKSGVSYFTFSIDKIGIKDVPSFGYIDPYLIVSVADARGCVLCQQQTPVSRRMEGQYIYFEETMVHLEVPIEHISEGNCGIFFELMHYKPSKHKGSCRCWAMMEQDELAEGDLALELYKKPADYLRKNIKLFTVKDLFLHIKGFIRTHRV